MELQDLRLIIKVADTGGLSSAAKLLGLSRSAASQRLAAVEIELGATLFTRTTRAIALTADGQQLLERARRLVADADELASSFAGHRNLKGRVRADVPTAFARSLVLPRLHELLALHPQLAIELSTSDRRVDLRREGLDCVLRMGGLGDPSLTVLKLGMLPMMTCVSPGYVQRYGLPRTPEDLGEHIVVHYAQSLDEGAPSLELMAGDLIIDHPMRHLIAVNGIDAYRVAGLSGFGIIQAPRYSIVDEVASGALIEVLPGHTAPPMPVAIVHPYGRNAPRRVRVFMSWLASLIEPHLRPAAAG